MRADVVVVGAGPSGCVMARRLADAGADVVLVEAGGAEASGRAGLLDVGPSSEVISRHPARLGDRVLELPRGRAPGGSGAVNGGYCVPAAPSDIATWGPDWPRRYAWGLARAAERLRPVVVWAGAVTAGVVSAFPGRASAVPQARMGGRRVTAFGAWDPVGAGVRVVTGYTARRLLWAGDEVGGRCEGVVLDRTGPRAGRGDGFDDDTTREISAPDVVVCAGAIGTAELLLGSGIGPGSGPGMGSGHPVGVSVQEHPELLLDVPADLHDSWIARRGATGPGSPADELPPLLSHVVRLEVSGGAEIEVRPYSVPMHHVVPGLAELPLRIGVSVMNPVGRGQVVPGGPGGPGGPDAPGVMVGLPDDPGDAAALSEGAALVADRLGIDPSSRGLTPSTSQHLSGTARIGEVVDDAGRLLGAEGVRVADASVFPRLPRRGPFYSVLAVAEVLAADMIAGRAW